MLAKSHTRRHWDLSIRTGGTFGVKALIDEGNEVDDAFSVLPAVRGDAVQDAFSPWPRWQHG